MSFKMSYVIVAASHLLRSLEILSKVHGYATSNYLNSNVFT